MITISPYFDRRLDELSPASDRIWLAGLTIGLTLTLIAAFAPLPPGGGTMLAYLGLLVRSALYLRAGDVIPDRGGAVLRGLIGIGMVAGLFELIVDWCLVNVVTNGRLDYREARDVVLLASPIWMPLAWACVIVELGYPALRIFALLRRRMNPARAAMIASMIAGLSAGITVGFYEYFAYLAGWWQYAPAHYMIGGYCALFIPVGEAFMFLTILPVAARTFARDDRPVASAIEGGAIFSLAIFAGYALAYALLELGRAP
jgi:hypothetical protein